MFNKLNSLIPNRFLIFILVGLTGTIIHLVTLALFHPLLQLPFMTSQAIATYTAMTSNYLINNRTTFKDKQHSGLNLITGLLSFYFICTLGALISIQLAQFLYIIPLHWALAGFLGGVSGSVFNYAFSSLFTWKTHKS